MIIDWRMGKHIEKNPIGLRDNNIAAIESLYYVGDERGYQKHYLDIRLFSDGSVAISEQDSDGFIYLYSEQVKHLLDLVKDSEITPTQEEAD